MLMFTTFLASAVINGGGSYVLGFVVALASGLVLGAVLMLASCVSSAVIEGGGSYWRGFVLGQVSGLVLGAVVERLVGRPIENAPPLISVILTLGLYTLLVAIAGMIWGNTPRSFPAAFSLRGYTVGGTTLLFTPNDTFIVLIVIAVAAGLALFFRATTLGLQMRASAFAPEVAKLLGVRVGRMFTL